MSASRVGIGYDVHRFGEGRVLVVGGVEVPHDQGVIAHSDGDVLLHALMDALLGAMALGDIGQRFPDDDPRHEGASSRELLRDVAAELGARSLHLLNLDAVIICQAPRMAPHLEAMRANIAADLGCEPDRVGLKATTTEGLGAIGRGEGIAAQCVVLLGSD